MAKEYNVIEARLTSRDRKCVIGPLWQYDYGQILKITGIDLPDAFEVHFSNDPRCDARPMPATAKGGVRIPDEYLESGANVFAWMYVYQNGDAASTEYQIEIQVRRRAKPMSYEPETEEEESIIAGLIENRVQSSMQDFTDAVNANTEAIEALKRQLAASEDLDGKYFLQNKNAIPSKDQQTIKADTGYYGLDTVTVEAIPDQYQNVSPVTAQAGHVLEGDVFVDHTGKQVPGTMKNNGAQNLTIDVLSQDSIVIPEGYTSGGALTVSDDLLNALKSL